MLGRKTKNPSSKKPSNINNKKAKFQVNSTKDRLSKNRKDDKIDEEIVSESEEENQLKDDFFEEEQTENTDLKRLRLAKNMINKIEGELKEQGDDRDVDEYLNEEIKKEEKDFHVEITQNLNPRITAFRKGHKGAITDIDIASDNSFVLSVSKDTRAIKWDLISDKKILLPSFTQKPLLACAITSDSKFCFLAGKDKFIYQMDIHNEKIVNKYKAHNAPITGICFDDTKEQFYSCSSDNTLKVWATGVNNNSIMIETFYGHTDKVLAMDLMSGNRLITCGFDKQINLWKVDSQSFLQFKYNELYTIDTLTALNNSCFLSGDSEGGIAVWRTNKKKPLFKLPACHGVQKQVNFEHRFFNTEGVSFGETYNINNPILSLASVKNSDLVFSGSNDGKLNFYKYYKDNYTIENINSIDLGLSCVNSIKVSKTGDFLIATNSKEPRLGRWDVVPTAKNGISIVKLFD
jgi:ribosomal RNA-processing protein 9